jgi:hypothetical protein
MILYTHNLSSDILFKVLGINTTMNKDIVIEYEYYE